MYLILKRNNNLVQLNKTYKVAQHLPIFRDQKEVTISKIIHPSDEFPQGMIHASLNSEDGIGGMPARLELMPSVIEAHFVDETFKRLCPTCNIVVLFETQDLCKDCEDELKAEAGI